MSYVLFGGIIVVVGIVLWAAGETWIERRRYRHEARAADLRLASAIRSATLHKLETQNGGLPYDASSEQVVQRPATTLKTGRQRKVRRAS